MKLRSPAVRPQGWGPLMHRIESWCFFCFFFLRVFLLISQLNFVDGFYFLM